MGQADITALDGLDPFQQQLLEQSTFIAVFYGAVFIAGLVILALFASRLPSRPLEWSFPRARFLERPWDYRDAALIIFPLVLVQALFAAVYAIKDTESSTPSLAAEQHVLVLQSILFHGLCFLLIRIGMRKKSINWRQGFGINASLALADAGWGVMMLVGFMPVILSVNVAVQLAMQWWGIEPQIQDVTQIISSASGWGMRMYFILLAVVVAPVVEEMLFRGVLLPALANVVGVRPALVAVGILFSVVHGFYMPAGLIFFMLSLGFSLAYIHRGSLLTPIVMHAIFNGMTMIVLIRL